MTDNDNANYPEWVKRYPPEGHYWMAKHGYDEVLDPRMASYNAELLEVGKHLGDVIDDYFEDDAIKEFLMYELECLFELDEKWKSLVDDHKARFLNRQGADEQRELPLAG